MFSEEKGFTLIELIVVVAIIAILGAVVTPNILKAIENSRVVAVVADSNVIKNAALAFRADTGSWPESSEAVSGDNGENKGGDPGFISSEVAGWDGPYLDRWPEKNPYGGAYMLYIYGGENNTKEKLYLQLDQVSENAFTKLQEKLGVTLVIKPQENNSDVIAIYLAE